jgi:hypothetical protein
VISSHIAASSDSASGNLFISESTVAPANFYKVADLSQDSYGKLKIEWKAGELIFYRSFRESKAVKRRAFCYFCKESFVVSAHSALSDHVASCSKIPTKFKTSYFKRLSTNNG